MVNGVYSDSFILGDGKVNQGGFVIIDGSHFVLLFHGKTLCESGPSREFLFAYGPFEPLMKPFSTSFKVAAKRLRSALH